MRIHNWKILCPTIAMLISGCAATNAEITRKDPNPFLAGAGHRLFVDMIWTVETAGKPSICVRYSTPDLPNAAMSVEFDRYTLPSGNSMERKTWLEATQSKNAGDGKVTEVFKIGEQFRAGLTEGPLACTRNWRTGGPIVGLCVSNGFMPLQRFGPCDRPVYLDGDTAIMEIPTRAAPGSVESVHYQYVRIDASGRQTPIPVPAGTHDFYCNGQVNISVGQWGSVAMDRAGKILWRDPELQSKEYEDDGISPRDYFVVQKPTGFEVRAFATGRASFIAPDCVVAQAACRNNMIAITGYERLDPPQPAHANDFSLWIVRDGSLARKIQNAGYFPQILRATDEQVVSVDNSLFVSPDWNRTVVSGLPCLLVGDLPITDDAMKQHLTVSKFQR